MNPVPEKLESKVLVLYTGGTIGMQTKNNVYVPVHNYLFEAIRRDRSLNDAAYVEKYHGDDPGKPCALPPVRGETRRILYYLIEYDPLLDSSDMSFNEWIKIAKHIHEAYDRYDGFVVLHGTDTLSFTASALSFIFEHLGKTIVLTGSQIPISEVRCDGRENLVGSLIIAGNYDIPEVCIFFNSKLLRGNRATKFDCEGLNAFDSPNCPPLATMGTTVTVQWEMVHRSRSARKVSVELEMNQHVAILRIFPNIPYECLEAFFKPPIQGVVLQTFGGGNIPSNRNDMTRMIGEAVKNGTIVVNCTQCHRGSVDATYQTGKVLYDAGVLFGADMTVEAALTKLAYVLGKKNLSLEERKVMMLRNLRGELTVAHRIHGVHDHELITKIATALNLTTGYDMRTLRAMLYPPLICQAACTGNLAFLRTLKDGGVVLTCTDYLQRSPLHYAAAAGKYEVVKFLLDEGVSVHIRDRSDSTALLEAVHCRRLDIIKLLRHAGAVLTYEPKRLSVQLAMVAASNDLELMEAWSEAGADLTVTDYDGRNALHVASSIGNSEMVSYLLDKGVNPFAVDSCGHTALDKALVNKQKECARTIRKYLERRPSWSSEKDDALSCRE